VYRVPLDLNYDCNYNLITEYLLNINYVQSIFYGDAGV
jgi:hypothetical protein